MNTKIIHLKNDFLECDVSPNCGGSLLNLVYHAQDGKDHHILRQTPPSALTRKDANGTSLFPLIPYSNRIRKGKFVYWGILRKVPKNKSGVPDPIHGDGWVSAWTVENVTENSVTLKLDHDKENGGFPFSYQSFVTYTLDGTTLRTDLKISNNATLPMPCGLGIHPYFPKTADVELEFKSKTIWAHELDAIAVDPYKTPARWNFDTKRALGNLEMDTCFGGNNGKSTIYYPKKNLKIDMKAEPDFSHLVLYAPKNKSFFALEHVTNANDAFNLATNSIIGTGIKSIGPHESISESISLTVSEMK